MTWSVDGARAVTSIPRWLRARIRGYRPPVVAEVVVEGTRYRVRLHGKPAVGAALDVGFIVFVTECIDTGRGRVLVHGDRLPTTASDPDREM